MDQPTHVRDYLLGNSSREQERLKMQASIVGGWTRGYLVAAGLQPGMRVLDIGTGMGDVGLLAAEIVGPTGTVVGIDRDGAVVQKAAARCVGREGVAPIAFVEADVMAFASEEPFDAVIGRYILLYQPDPVKALRRLCTLLRKGGILCFHEMAFGSRMCGYPAKTLFSDMLVLVSEVFRRSGVDPDMGLKLAKHFADAGLPRPTLHGDAPMGAGAGSYIYGWAAETIRSLLPRLEQLGLAKADEIQIDTLAERMEEEMLREHGEVMGPLQVGGWVRLP